MKKFALKIVLFLFLLSPAPPAAAQDETPIADDSASPVAMVERAYLEHRRGNFDAAVAGYSALIQTRGLSPRERAISYLLRAEAKRDAGRPDEAIDDLNAAVRQWDRYPQAHYMLGLLYEEQGLLFQAYENLTRALDLDPDRESYNNSLVSLKKKMEEAGLTPGEGELTVMPDRPDIPAGEAPDSPVSRIESEP